MAKMTGKQFERALRSPGVHGDGDGLYLRVKPSGAASWVLRVQHQGKREDIGLGAVAILTLAEAREEARRLRKIAKRGGNARVERDKAIARSFTFEEVMRQAHAELGQGWSDKSAKSFLSSLSEHIVPRIGAHSIDEIDAASVRDALAKVWVEKPALARKLRTRILRVLRFAKANGWRSDALPLAAEISDGLPDQPKAKNMASMPYQDVPAFFDGELDKEQTTGRQALLFTILTAARNGEVRKARWEQIDLERREWSRPADIMKSGKAHVVTLSPAAIALLNGIGLNLAAEQLVFPGARRGSMLSDMTLTKALRSAGEPCTVHGFRSSFRDWAAEQMPRVPAMVAEMALAHNVGSKTEQAYLRSDLRDMRASLMDAWGRYVAPSLSGEKSNVVAMNAAAQSAYAKV